MAEDAEYCERMLTMPAPIRPYASRSVASIESTAVRIPTSEVIPSAMIAIVSDALSLLDLTALKAMSAFSASNAVRVFPRLSFLLFITSSLN